MRNYKVLLMYFSENLFDIAWYRQIWPFRLYVALLFALLIVTITHPGGNTDMLL